MGPLDKYPQPWSQMVVLEILTQLIVTCNKDQATLKLLRASFNLLPSLTRSEFTKINLVVDLSPQPNHLAFRLHQDLVMLTELAQSLWEERVNLASLDKKSLRLTTPSVSLEPWDSLLQQKLGELKMLFWLEDHLRRLWHQFYIKWGKRQAKLILKAP